MKGYKPPESNDAPDLTPMIDVVFLLIVFFMVVAQQLSEKYIEIKSHPIASNSKLNETAPSRTIITIDETEMGQQYYWGQDPIEEHEIGDCINSNPEWKVFLRVHPAVTHSVVQQVLKAIGNAGQVDVVFATWEAASK